MKSEEFLQKVPLLTPSQGKHFGGCEILKAPQKRKKTEAQSREQFYRRLYPNIWGTSQTVSSDKVNEVFI